MSWWQGLGNCPLTQESYRFSRMAGACWQQQSAPALLFCTHSHLLMPQDIITQEGTPSALVTGQLPAETREVVSLFNVPRSQVDRSKRPQCSTKQRTQSQSSSQPPGTTPDLLHGSLGCSCHTSHISLASAGRTATCAALPSTISASAGERDARLGQLLPPHKHKDLFTGAM